MPNQLALSARPRTLDALVGQDKLVRAIRGHAKSKREVKTWLFAGPRGVGKTSIAKILAISYQCPHQPKGKFGNPCLACRKNKSSFPIHEYNSADKTGVGDLRDALQGSTYGVLGTGKRRVYILDECHRLSENAQDLLLKYLEDSPPTTIFILCSTRPWAIVETIRSRCLCYEVPELDSDHVEILVTRLLKKVGSDLPADRLTEALIEQQVFSPRNICNAVEKYLAGELPDNAARVDAVATIDIHALTRSIVKGDWNGVRTYLLNSEKLDIRAVRLGLIAYLRVILLESAEIGIRTKVVADALTQLATVQYAEQGVISSVLGAVLYRVTEMFSKYQR